MSTTFYHTNSSGVSKPLVVNVIGTLNSSSYAPLIAVDLIRVEIGTDVTSIGGSAFFNGSNLTSVTIPDSVTSIGDSAFLDCSNLTSVTIEDASNITTINTNSFTDVSGTAGSYIVFKNITDYNSLPSDTWKTIAGYYETVVYSTIFYNLSNVPVYVDISGELTSNDYEADISKNQISRVVIGSFVTSIGNNAFRSCSSLTSVTIPDSVTSIGDSAFNSSALTSVIIGNNVTSIGNSVFRECSALTSVTIPDSVTSIGNSAFLSCSNLTSVTIPDSVTSIAGSAFENCSNLTSVTIPDSVTSIGIYAFYSCIALTSVTIEDANNTIVYSNSFTDVSGTAGSKITFYNTTELSELSATWQTIATTYYDSYEIFPYAPICFVAGTEIITDQGTIFIENINPKINTINNKKIVALTETISPEKYLVCIDKNALENNIPSKQTLVSRSHKISYQSQMLKAFELLDIKELKGITLVKYKKQPLYNVLLKKHYKMMANNMKVETLNPTSPVALLYMKLLKTPKDKHNEIIKIFNNGIKKQINELNKQLTNDTEKKYNNQIKYSRV